MFYKSLLAVAYADFAFLFTLVRSNDYFSSLSAEVP